MAKMHKLTKGGQTIYPATIYDAVVNPISRKSLATEISELEILPIKYIQSTTPSGSELGDIFFRNTDNSWFIYNGKSWVIYTPLGILYIYNETLYLRDSDDNSLINLLNIRDKEELTLLTNKALSAVKGIQYTGDIVQIHPTESRKGIIKTDNTIADNSGYYYDIYDVINYGNVTINTRKGTVAANPWSIIWELDENDTIINNIPAKGSIIPLVDYKLELQPKTSKIYVQRGSTVSVVTVNKSLSDEVKDLVVEAQRINELSNKVDDLSESLISYKLINLDYTETKNGWLINSSGNVVEHSAGKVLNKYSITDKKKIRIECTSTPNTNDLWLQFVFKKDGMVVEKGIPSVFPTPYIFEYDNKNTATELYVVGSTMKDIKVEADDGEEYNYVDVMKQNIEDYLMPINIILAWGDSLTYGQGGNGITYPKVLQELIDDNNDITEQYKVINCGVQGDTTPGILARQGGLSAFVKNDVTVPVSGGVECSIRTISMGENGSDWFSVSYNGDDSAVINPVMINGEFFNLRTGPKIEKINSNGEAVEIKAGSNILTYGARLSGVSYINIFYTGQNDGKISGYSEKRIGHLKQSMTFANSKKNLFISTAISRTEKGENEYQEAFGSAYINLYHEMSTRGVAIAIKLGLMNEGTPSTSWNVVDAGAINKNGLLNDSIHWNSIGYTVVAHIVFERLLSLGWLPKKQSNIVK